MSRLVVVTLLLLGCAQDVSSLSRGDGGEGGEASSVTTSEESFGGSTDATTTKPEASTSVGAGGATSAGSGGSSTATTGTVSQGGSTSATTAQSTAVGGTQSASTTTARGGSSTGGTTTMVTSVKPECPYNKDAGVTEGCSVYSRGRASCLNGVCTSNMASVGWRLDCDHDGIPETDSTKSPNCGYCGVTCQNGKVCSSVERNYWWDCV